LSIAKLRILQYDTVRSETELPKGFDVPRVY
jgi:hypothetical protein